MEAELIAPRALGGRVSVARRIAVASLLLVAAAVVCTAVLGGHGSGIRSPVATLSQLYSASGWDDIYGGGHASTGAWKDASDGADETGAPPKTGLHEEDDDSDGSDDADVDPDSARGDHHWNAAGDLAQGSDGSDGSDGDDAIASSSSKRAAATSGASSENRAAPEDAKKTKADKLIEQAKVFDKGLPTPKSRAEEKKQKAEQLAKLLRIQKELSSDYKVCCAHHFAMPHRQASESTVLRRVSGRRHDVWMQSLWPSVVGIGLACVVALTDLPVACFSPPSPFCVVCFCPCPPPPPAPLHSHVPETHHSFLACFFAVMPNAHHCPARARWVSRR